MLRLMLNANRLLNLICAIDEPPQMAAITIEPADTKWASRDSCAQTSGLPSSRQSPSNATHQPLTCKTCLGVGALPIEDGSVVCCDCQGKGSVRPMQLVRAAG